MVWKIIEKNIVNNGHGYNNNKSTVINLSSIKNKKITFTNYYSKLIIFIRKNLGKNC